MTLVFSSCTKEEVEPNTNSNTNPNPVLLDHTYSVAITSGFLSGTNYSGTIPNEDFMGLYNEIPEENLVLLTQSLEGPSGFIFGGQIGIQSGQPFALSEAINGFNGSGIIIAFDIDTVTYVFESISGSCSVDNFIQYPTTEYFGLASYTLNFSGTFRQANSGLPDEDAPLCDISGVIQIQKVE